MSAAARPTILCATDLEPSGTGAIDAATGLARWLDARLIVLHAADAYGAFLHDRLRAQMNRAGERGADVDSVMRVERPWEAVVHEASARRASLVVLGRRAENPQHVAEQVVRRVLCPVLVVPDDRTISDGLPGPVVVATDFSDEALDAVRVARVLASLSKSELVVTHVGPPRDRSALVRELEELVRDEAFEARPSLRASSGAVADELCAVADEEDAALLVVGTHGRSGLPRLFLGSVAERVLRRSHRPVLVVRAAPPPVAPWTSVPVVGAASATAG